MSEDASVKDLLQCLVGSSEKAARIARAFRKEESLFGLLIEEKSDKEINQTLVKDFKTLADVVVQETIKRDVAAKFPILASQVRGEEQNVFQNTLGEQIKVELSSSLQETSDLLCKVLDGKKNLSESLAGIIHLESNADIDYTSDATIPTDQLGIWIDPIDSTGEYIEAKQVKSEKYGFDVKGLRSVSILIGVYSLETGLPVMGILNQPFYEECESDERWKSCIYWGISYKEEKKTSETVSLDTSKQKIIVTSSFESKQLWSIMKPKYSIIHPAGAGYKCLLVVQGAASLYVLSFDSTHFWDICGPHAILTALGGGVVSFSAVVNSKESIDRSNVSKYQLTYSGDLSEVGFKNVGGIIAYKNEEDLFEFLHWLKDSGYSCEELK